MIETAFKQPGANGLEQAGIFYRAELLAVKAHDLAGRSIETVQLLSFGVGKQVRRYELFTDL